MCNFSSDPLDKGTLKLPESTVGMSLRKGCSSPSIPIYSLRELENPQFLNPKESGRWIFFKGLKKLKTLQYC